MFKLKCNLKVRWGRKKKKHVKLSKTSIFWWELDVLRQKTALNSKKRLISGMFGVVMRGLQASCTANSFDDLECLNMYV